MLATHNFAADERPEPPPAVESRNEVLATWGIALLLFSGLASGFVIDQVISCAAAADTVEGGAAAADAQAGSTCTPIDRPDPSRQWRNPASLRWALPLRLQSVEDDLLEKANAR